MRCSLKLSYIQPFRFPLMLRPSTFHMVIARPSLRCLRCIVIMLHILKLKEINISSERKLVRWVSQTAHLANNCHTCAIHRRAVRWIIEEKSLEDVCSVHSFYVAINIPLYSFSQSKESYLCLSRILSICATALTGWNSDWKQCVWTSIVI